MKTKIGLWIHRRKAIVVAVTDTGEETRFITSSVERDPSRSGDSPLKGRYDSQQVSPDDHRQRRLAGHLKIYHDAVIASIRDAESVFMFGPGEAHEGLTNRRKKASLGECIVAVETADKTADHQVAARIRKHFHGSTAPE